MCGIGGILGVQEETARSLAGRMLRALEHRGPDNQRVEVVRTSTHQRPIVLVHARLSILDLTDSGMQPMADYPTDVSIPRNWIVYNGEVYNFRELGSKLVEMGRPLRSRSDTEVILAAYRAYGVDSVERFAGMFAWALLDVAKSTVWFCRDRFGIKPLYLTRPPGGGLLFASELRALLSVGEPWVSGKIRASARESFLSQGAVWGDEAFVENIEMLSPGTSLITDWSGNILSQKRYWQIPANSVPQTQSRDAILAEVRERLNIAVGRCFVSDVPVGLFLSSGVDSGVIAHIASHQSKNSFVTLSVGFDVARFDETEDAEKIARELGSFHHTIRVTSRDVLDHLDAALAAMDHPTVDGFNTYFVSSAAHSLHIKVALSGLGGDELFAGYASFRDVPRASMLLKLLPWRDKVANATALLKGRGATKVAEMLSRRNSLAAIYLLRRELSFPKERRLLQPVPGGCDQQFGVTLDIMRQLEVLSSTDDPVNSISRFELSGYLRYMLLRDTDAFSMAHGLEVRVPFLDHELVDYVLTLPGSIKVAWARQKPLLVDAFSRELGNRELRKKGFTFPWDHWLRGPLKSKIEPIISSDERWLRAGIYPSGVRQMWERFLRRDPRVTALQVLSLLVLAKFVERHNLSSTL